MRSSASRFGARGLRGEVPGRRLYARFQSAREPWSARWPSSARLRRGKPIRPSACAWACTQARRCEDADDFHGRDVVLAARIADHALGGEILVSALLKQLTERTGVAEFTEARDVELKGLDGTHRIYGVKWQHDERELGVSAE